MSLINTANFVVEDHDVLYLVRQYRGHGADNLTTAAAFVKGAFPHELNGTKGAWDRDYFTVQLVTVDSLSNLPALPAGVHPAPWNREAEFKDVIQSRSRWDHLTVIDSRDIAEEVA